MNIQQLLGPAQQLESGRSRSLARGEQTRSVAMADIQENDSENKVLLKGVDGEEGAENNKLQRQQQRLNQESHQYKDLTDSEKKMVNELRVRDREVRTHERAHKALAGNLAGPVQYSYQTGPDGKKYAIGGEIDIDTSSVPGNPEATAQKAEQIIRAAYAAAEPSPQDRRVAAQAQQMLVQARQDLHSQEVRERNNEQEVRAERVKEVREKAEEAAADVVETEEQYNFFENANIIENGGAEVINLIQAGNESRKADLPDVFADSVLAFDGSAVIEQFLATQEMISTDGFMSIGGRMDLYA